MNVSTAIHPHSALGASSRVKSIYLSSDPGLPCGWSRCWSRQSQALCSHAHRRGRSAAPQFRAATRQALFRPTIARLSTRHTPSEAHHYCDPYTVRRSLVSRATVRRCVLQPVCARANQQCAGKGQSVMEPTPCCDAGFTCKAVSEVPPVPAISTASASAHAHTCNDCIAHSCSITRAASTPPRLRRLLLQPALQLRTSAVAKAT